jgi:hypothetical protein
LGAIVTIQLATATRLGRRTGATASIVQQANHRPPRGIENGIHPA